MPVPHATRLNVLNKVQDYWKSGFCSQYSFLFKPRITSSRRPTFHSLIECQIQFNLVMTLTLRWPWPTLWHWPQTCKTKLNWCAFSQISIFQCMTLTLIQWPLYWSRCTNIPKMKFLCHCFKSYSPNRQTDTETLSLSHTRQVIPKEIKNVNWNC